MGRSEGASDGQRPQIPNSNASWTSSIGTQISTCLLSSLKHMVTPVSFLHSIWGSHPSKGSSVGMTVGGGEGNSVGIVLGEALGKSVGKPLGKALGKEVGEEVGKSDGTSLGLELGMPLGSSVSLGGRVNGGKPAGGRRLPSVG